ncbi:MAG: hypothetical protein Q9224_004533 [Gallowayella concinna]
MSKDDPDALERLLMYLYTADYEDWDQIEGDDLSISNIAEKHDNGSSTAKPQNALSTHDADQTLDLSTTESSTANLARQDALSETDSEPDRVMVSALLNNVFVYALAAKYDIRDLKKLSKSKFKDRTHQGKWEDQDILAVLEQVYATTPITDRGLRDVMLVVLGRYMDRLMPNCDFLRILKQNTMIAYELLQRVHQDKTNAWSRLVDCRSRLSHLSEQDYDLKRKTDELIMAKAATESMESELRITKSALTTAEDHLRDERSALASTKQILSLEKDWAQEHGRLLKRIIQKHAKCSHCPEPLDVSVIRGSSVTVETPVSAKCNFCGELFTDY